MTEPMERKVELDALPSAPSDETAPWLRLDVRMLLIHPIRELLRAWPVLLGLIFVGRSSALGGQLWGLIGAVMIAGLALARWATTMYRATPEQVQVRRGLLRREVLTVPRDRVRTVDVTASPLHRLLGLARVAIGTGLSDRRNDALKLDGITVTEAERLRVELLHRPVVAAPELPTAQGATRASAQGAAQGATQAATQAATRVAAQATGLAGPPAELVLARLRPAWLRYGPFSLSGLVIVAVVVGFLSRLVNEANVQLTRFGPVLDFVDRLSHRSLWLVIPAVLLVVVVVVAATSTAAYLVAFWGFRLSRQPGGTLHIVRGLFTTRSITIEERRLRGVELSEPLLLRLARGARCIAIATGLRVGRGAERGGSLLMPPGPRTEAVPVAGAVLGDPAPVTAVLTRHGPRARRRRYTRALLTTGLVSVLCWLLFWLAGWPRWLAVASLFLLVLALPLAEDRYRSLGHTLSEHHFVTREGSLVRRRNMLTQEGIIGWNLRQSFFQRRAGLITVEATTAAGRQRYAAEDVPAELAVPLADRAVPDLLTPFLARH